MKTKGKLSLTVIFLILFLGAIIALESLNNYVSGADVGTLALTLSTAPNNITLISPEDGRTISEEATLMFEYMPSSALNIASCTLILNGTLTQTNSSAIVVEATLNFSRLMHFGTYNWGVSCTSTTDIQFNSSTRLLTVASTAIAPAPIRTGNQPPNPVTEIVSTVFIGDVTANEAKIITDIDERTGVARIAIKTTKYIQNAKATIKLLYDKPADVETPNGFSYKYISIGIPALTEDTLSEAEIEFFVDKQWMFSNDISTKSVHLARYQQATGWQYLPTMFSRESGTNIYYIAQTPGFSTFAIVADSPGLVAPDVTAETPKTETSGVPVTPTLFFHLPRSFALPNLKATTITIITLIAILTIAGVAVIAKSFESEEIQKLSEYITTASNRGNEIKAVEGVLLKYGWNPDTIKKAVLHHRLKRIFRREKKR